MHHKQILKKKNTQISPPKKLTDITEDNNYVCVYVHKNELSFSCACVSVFVNSYPVFSPSKWEWKIRAVRVCAWGCFHKKKGGGEEEERK